jgi:hypothetical protein
LYPKCPKTRLRAVVISKNFPRVISPDPRYKREGKGTGHRKGRGREEKGEEERKMGKGAEVWETLPRIPLQKSRRLYLLSTVETAGHVRSELHDSEKSVKI